MSTEERKLAAIVFTDICGFTELMSRDENKAMALLEQQRTLLKPIINNFNGEWLKEIGDGILISFPSAVKAVTCSLEIQRILAHNPDLTLRIGIHIGDVIKKGSDVFGDGVNIASRLEPLAEPGGICVSERVHEDIKNKPDISAAFQEEQLLKGVEKPIKVYSIFTRMGAVDGLEIPKVSDNKKLTNKTPFLVSIIVISLLGVFFYAYNFMLKGEILEERKSIAVLPFDNMSEDDNSEYFSDGITEDIITYLSKIEDLKVISRTSIMQYKDSKKNLKDIAKELGVNNILEGSVRKVGNRVRITGQLIDAKTDEHLWADIYDRDLDDIFSVQTEVAKNIATALKAEMTDEDIIRLNKTMTTNPDAYELLLKIKGTNFLNRQDNLKREEILKKVVLLDPESAYAYARLGGIHTWIYFFGMDRTKERLKMAKEALDRALELDPLSATAHLELGFYHYAGFLDFEKGLKEYEIANRLEPNNPDIKWRISLVLRRQGKFEESFELMKKCFDLDPKNKLYPDQMILMTSYLGISELFDGYFNVANELGMDLTTGLMYKVSEKYGRNGDLEQYGKIVEEANKTDHDTWFHRHIAEYYRIIGNYELALLHIDMLRNEDYSQQTSYMSKEYFKGVVYSEMDRDDKSNALFKKALMDVEQQLIKENDDPRFLASKGKILAYLGQKDNAIKFGRMATDIVSVNNDKLQGVDYNYDLAKIYSISGEFDQAIDEIRKIQNVQPQMSLIGFLINDAEFSNIQKYSGFRELINSYREEQGL